MEVVKLGARAFVQHAVQYAEILGRLGDDSSQHHGDNFDEMDRRSSAVGAFPWRCIAHGYSLSRVPGRLTEQKSTAAESSFLI